MNKIALIPVCVLLSIASAGCARFSPDGALSSVEALAAAPLDKNIVAVRNDDDAEQVREEAHRLLKKPLTANSAVQIALLQNRELQAAYNALGISEAVMVQAHLPPNPTFSFERISGGGSYEIEARVVASILSLLTLPARASVAKDRFAQAQLQASEATLRIAAEARRAFSRAVATRTLADFLGEAQSAAEAAAELSQRLGETGSMTKLDQARNQVFYAELAAQRATMRQRASSDRERLTRAMGLWGSDSEYRITAALPPLPSNAAVMPTIEVEAVRRRLDLQVARLEVQAVAKSYGLTKATRFINLLDAGAIATKKREGGETERERGYEIEFQIPIFDFGEVRARQAEETYLQAVNRLTARAVSVRSEARDAYRVYRSAFDLARHYQREVLPLRKIISDETLLRYNAMQIDVFALLTEARQRITSTMAAIESERDFWIAATNLSTAVIGGGSAGDTEPGTAAVATAESPRGH